MDPPWRVTEHPGNDLEADSLLGVLAWSRSGFLFLVASQKPLGCGCPGLELDMAGGFFFFFQNPGEPGSVEMCPGEAPGRPVSSIWADASVVGDEGW